MGVQIVLRVPLTYQQRRVLIIRFDVLLDRAAAFSSLDRLKNVPECLNKLSSILRLYRNSRGVQNHRPYLYLETQIPVNRPHSPIQFQAILECAQLQKRRTI